MKRRSKKKLQTKGDALTVQQQKPVSLDDAAG